jgi:hypothetical protein
MIYRDDSSGPLRPFRQAAPEQSENNAKVVKFMGHRRGQLANRHQLPDASNCCSSSPPAQSHFAVIDRPGVRGTGPVRADGQPIASVGLLARHSAARRIFERRC